MSEYYNPEEKMKNAAFFQATRKELGEAADVGRIREEMNKMPVNRMINAANYLIDNLLPAVEKKGGKNSADFKFFCELVELLLSAVVMHDRINLLERKLTDAKIDYLLCREKLTWYESELQKYTTLEDIWMSEGFEYIARGIRERAEALLNRRQKSKF